MAPPFRASVPLCARTVPSLSVGTLPLPEAELGPRARGGTATSLPPLLALVQPGSEALPATETGMTSRKLTTYEPARSPAFSIPPLPHVISRCQSVSGWLADSHPTQTPAPPLPPLLTFCPVSCAPLLSRIPFLLNPTAVSGSLSLPTFVSVPFLSNTLISRPLCLSPSLWPCCHHDSWGSPSPQPLLPPSPWPEGTWWDPCY